MAGKSAYSSGDEPGGEDSGGPGMSPRPAIYLLMGYPGTGKYNVAREVVRQLLEVGHETKLVDNHTIADLLFPLVPQADGSSPLPPQLIVRYQEAREIVLQTIEELSPPEWSFVFTVHLVDSEGSRRFVKRLESLAHQRGSAFAFVTLTCDPEELLRRVTQPERHGRKLVDPGRATEYLAAGMLRPEAAEALRLDITSLPPAEAAAVILEHVGR
jgi:hypothetical protein